MVISLSSNENFTDMQVSSTSVADPEPNPDPDSHVFGPPSPGSFYHKAKIVRKTLISTVLRLLFDFLSLKNYVSVPS